MNEVILRRIDESNFLDAFHLTLAPGQEAFVSHPIRSLAQAYVYYRQCTPFGIYHGETMVGYVMVIYDYDLEEYDLAHDDRFSPAGPGLWQSRHGSLPCLHRRETLRRFGSGGSDLQQGEPKGHRTI